MSEFDRFYERFLQCNRQIDFVTLANDACNQMAPNELAQFYRLIDQSDSSENRANFAKVAHGWIRYRGKGRWWNARPRKFANVAVCDGVRLFQSAGEVREKTLLILVSGGKGRIMLPVASFLESLPEVPMDVVFLKNSRDRHFRLGVDGLARSFAELAVQLPLKFETREYQQLVVMGMSSGGLPALALANAISADLGIAIEGRFPNDLFRIRRHGQQKLSAFFPICACMPQSAGHLIAAFGAGSEIDVSDAHLAQKSFGNLELLPVPGSNAHGLLGPIFFQDKLPGFLGLVLNLPPRRSPSNSIWAALKAAFQKT